MDIDSIISILDARFLAFLVAFDRQFFEKARSERCHFCGSRLHSACRERKLHLPEGIVAVDDCNKYFSLCCSNECCRKRHNPKSLRFAGRSPNLAILIIFAGFLKKGRSERKLQVLSKSFGVTERTLCRWKLLWQRIYGASKQWRRLKMVWCLGGQGVSHFLEKMFPEKKADALGLIAFIEKLSPIFEEVSLCSS